MWTPTTRVRHSRASLRYGSDLTDAEWAVLEPLLPAPCRCGRPRRWPLREVVNAIFYVLRCGCPWRLLPKDLPPWRTAYRWFAHLRDEGTWEDMNFVLVVADRERVGRASSPSAAVLDSQSVRTTESGGPRGYDAGKKVWGRKRHALVDTDGRVLVLQTHPASVQDRDGAGPMKASRRLYPFIERAFADAAYAGDKLAEWCRREGRWRLEVVKRRPVLRFEAVPRRWVAERTLAWISRNRRLARDYERLVQTTETLIEVAMVRLMLRPLAPA